MRSVMLAFLAQNRPQTDDDPSHTRKESRVISCTVAAEPIGTVALTIGSHDRAFIVDGTVQQVEDVSAEDGSKRHGAPVLRETADAERVRYQRREDAEQEAVGYAGHARHEHERVGVGDGRAGELGAGEHDS